MYSVTKRIDFCYGHRLLDYDGICKHPHGHNAVAEIEVRTDQLDNRNMVCDFSDIKRIVKGWIDRELDHRMVLRHDDPLVAPLKQLGEPMYLVDSNPTVERIARLIFDYASSQNLPVVRVKVWETPTSFAEYGQARGDASPAPSRPFSISTARSSIPCTIWPSRSTNSLSLHGVSAAPDRLDRPDGRGRRGHAGLARLRSRLGPATR